MGSNIHGAHKDNMAARKQLVDMMFKRFDADNNGKIEANELSQVRVLNKDELKYTMKYPLQKRNNAYFTQSITRIKVQCINLTLPCLPLIFWEMKMYVGTADL